MKFEQLLNFYWNKYFFYSNNILPLSAMIVNFKEFFGVNSNFILILFKKLELNIFKNGLKTSLIKLTRKKKRVINILLVKIFNANYEFIKLISFNLIRKFIIRNWVGIRIFFNEPSRGGRTRSNAKIDYRFSNYLKKKLKDLKKNNKKTSVSKKNYFIHLKKKTKKINFIKKKKISKLDILIKNTFWM